MLTPMRFRPLVTLFVLAAGSALSACANKLTDPSTVLLQVITPYKIDIVQGNVITREQTQALKTGMPRNQVKDILGTPLLASVFHADRWDYVFSFKRQGADYQQRQVAVFFKNDRLERVEADNLPSESEFAATLRSSLKIDKLPPMTASEESLQNFPVTPKPPPAPVLPMATEYPPLEQPTAR